MKQKIKKIIINLAQLGTVIWAVYGMFKTATSDNWMFRYRELWPWIAFYFLSAILILYLLRKYEKSI